MSLKSVLTVTTLGAALLVAGASSAQQKPDFDAVPEKMPFDIPYGAPISLDKAQAAIAAAVAESKKRGWKMNVAVMDSGGNLVAFQRMDGAQLASIEISEHKARAAVMFRRESKIFENALHSGVNYVMTLRGMVGSRGGIPLVVDGKMVGAIGCSGGTGSQDDTVCQVGAGTVK
jgi:glc operon protein GlcG